MHVLIFARNWASGTYFNAFSIICIFRQQKHLNARKSAHEKLYRADDSFLTIKTFAIFFTAQTALSQDVRLSIRLSVHYMPPVFC